MKRSILLSIFCLLSACKNDKKMMMVGVTAGPHTKIMEDVVKRAKKQGLEVKIVEFNDFVMPNEALNAGDIDVNCFQHRPFLDEQARTRGYKLKEIGKTILLPIRLYSKKYKTLQDIPEKATVAIPNDPSNRGRALLLLQQVGLIRLNPSEHPTVLDICDNPKNISIKEIEAPNLPRVLSDVDAAIINTDWMLVAKEDTRTFLAQEKPEDNPYVNILVVKEGREKEPSIKKFLHVYHSEETVQFVQKTFQGDILIGFHAHSGNDHCCS